MRRVAQGQEFRSNVHRGGVAEAIDLPEAYRETAVRSAQILGLRVAGAIVEYIAARVDFPEIDVRQRLTVSSGYGVSEIHIREGSDFEGMSIAETKLRDSDVNVLTLYRGKIEIPNPRAERKLEAEDRLLCFGKLNAMRGLIPPKSQRRRRPKIKNLSPGSTV